MISYKTMYIIYIILCLMAYTDSGKTSKDQKLCKKNLQDDFDCPANHMIKSDKLILPRKAFQNKVLNQLKTTHGVGYLMKILEKAAPGLTESPRDFCNRIGIQENVPSSLCMEQLHDVYHIANENNALPVIKWTYLNKSESDIPKTFNITNEDDEVVQFKHFAYAYFKHMLFHLDVYVSIPRPVAFCQNQEPHHLDRNQNYLNIDSKYPEGSFSGEMTVKQLRKTGKNPRKESKPNTSSLNN